MWTKAAEEALVDKDPDLANSYICYGSGWKREAPNFEYFFLNTVVGDDVIKLFEAMYD